MGKGKKAYHIICGELTKERKRILAKQEVVSINKALRAVMAVGGVWIFYYGTSFDVPEDVRFFAVIFTVVGLAAVLIAIFSQVMVEMSYFSSAVKKGCFPAEVSVGEGGVFIRRRRSAKDKSTPGVTSVNDEKFFAFPEVKDVSDCGDYFRMSLKDVPGVFLFKEDFEKGDPEAFVDDMAQRYYRS